MQALVSKWHWKCPFGRTDANENVIQKDNIDLLDSDQEYSKSMLPCEKNSSTYFTQSSQRHHQGI